MRTVHNGPMSEMPSPTSTSASPIIGVGAVILNPQGEVVLIRRGKEPRRGEWSIPGGRLEWGETVHDALVREVREETGLTVEIDALIDVVDAVTHNAAGEVIRHYVLVDFLSRPRGGELCAGSDAADARWVPFADLSEYALWSETRRIIEAALRMRG